MKQQIIRNHIRVHGIQEWLYLQICLKWTLSTLYFEKEFLKKVTDLI